jgi:NAD(P)-dependent dehydrogenase (short-subunit alcohol dehydrogenase family)
VLAVHCDVADEASVEQAFSQSLDGLAHLNTCVANAGIDAPPTRFSEITLADWRRIIAVNLDGAFLTLRAATRRLVEQGTGGSLIAVSSLAATRGKARGQHYAASKAGLVAMMNGLAVELGPLGIRANSLLPGWIETPLFERYRSNETFVTRVGPRVPMRRWGSPDELAGAVVYLASDASSYHTGDTLVIDGGYALF